MLEGLVLAFVLGTTPATPVAPAPAIASASYAANDGLHFVTSTPRPIVLVNDAQSRFSGDIYGNRYALPGITADKH